MIYIMLISYKQTRNYHWCFIAPNFQQGPIKIVLKDCDISKCTGEISFLLN